SRETARCRAEEPRTRPGVQISMRYALIGCLFLSTAHAASLEALAAQFRRLRARRDWKAVSLFQEIGDRMKDHVSCEKAVRLLGPPDDPKPESLPHTKVLPPLPRQAPQFLIYRIDGDECVATMTLECESKLVRYTVVNRSCR